MSEFKIGDRVRRVNTRIGDIPAGTLGVVTANEEYIMVEWDGGLPANSYSRLGGNRDCIELYAHASPEYQPAKMASVAEAVDHKCCLNKTAVLADMKATEERWDKREAELRGELNWYKHELERHDPKLVQRHEANRK